MPPTGIKLGDTRQWPEIKHQLEGAHTNWRARTPTRAALPEPWAGSVVASGDGLPARSDTNGNGRRRWWWRRADGRRADGRWPRPLGRRHADPQGTPGANGSEDPRLLRAVSTP